MMQALLNEFSDKGIHISAQGNELVIKAKPGALSHEDRSKLKVNKAELLAFFAACEQSKFPRNLPKAAESDRYPLSFVQHRLAIIDQLGGGSAQYNVPAVLELKGDLQVQHLEWALKQLFVANPQLSMGFAFDKDGVAKTIGEGEFYQRQITDKAFNLHFIDLRHEPDAEQRFTQIAIKEAQQPFELATDLKMRAILVQRESQRYQLLLTFHHIVTDGWSTALVIRDLNGFYRASLQGKTEDSEANLYSKAQYTDFAVWQRQHYTKDSLQPGLEYWQSRLAGAPDVHQIATDRPRGAKATYEGDNIFITLGTEVKERVQGFCRQNAFTDYVFWQGAFLWLNYLYSKEKKQVIGVPMANRPGKDVADIAGFFVNTLPFYCDINDSLSLPEWLRSLQKQNAKDMQHQNVPFDWIVDLIPDRSLSVHPIFQQLFVFQNNEQADFDLPDVKVELQNTFRKSALFDIQLEVQITDKVNIRWEYNSHLYDKATIERMANHYNKLVTLWLSESAVHKKLADMSLLQVASPDLLDFSLPPALNDQLRKQAEAHQEKAAVSFVENQVHKSMSYGELFSYVHSLSLRLQEQGIQEGDKVSLALPRGPEYIITLLACMQTGASFVPLDLNQPYSRHETILGIAKPKVVICQHDYSSQTPESAQDFTVIDAQTLRESVVTNKDDIFASSGFINKSSEDTILYTLFTSGTTGVPKGVEQTHNALANLVAGIKAMTPVFHQSLKAAFISPTAFDMAFTDIIMPLCSGGELVVLDDRFRRDMQLLCDEIQASQIQWLNLPYSLLQMLATHATSQNIRLNSLKVITSTAEALKITDEIRSFYKVHSDCLLVNHYGPTETHVVTATNMTGDPASWPALPTIGKEITGTAALVMDENLQQVVDGVPGELVIAGHSVAAGYWQLPEQTQEKFLMLDLAGHNVKAYRTGDKVYRNCKNELVYLGRLDRQVHFRGYRIELSEVEAVSRKFPGVQQCAAVLDPVKGIKLFVVAAAQNSEKTPAKQVMAADVIHFCKMHLPDYMTPVACHLITAIPLNANGKVDSQRLLSGEFDTTESLPVRAPQNETQAQLLSLWQSHLEQPVQDVSIDFFAAGGDSMRIVKLVNAIQDQWQVPFGASQFYLLPTIELQAQVIDLIKNQSLNQDEEKELHSFDSVGSTANPSHTDVLQAVDVWQNLVNESGALYSNEQQNLVLSVAHSSANNYPQDKLQEIFDKQGQTLSLLVPLIELDQSVQNGAGSTLEQADGADETSVSKVIPMSEHQRSIWVHMSTQEQYTLYNMPFAMKLNGILDTQLVQSCLNRVMAKHKALRYKVDDSQSTPMLRVSSQVHWPVREVDLQHLSEVKQQEKLICLMRESNFHEFDFYQGCLATATVVKMAPKASVLIVVVNHLAGDGFSSSILVNDFIAALNADETFDKASTDVEYAHFVEWQQNFLNSPRGQVSRDFWEANLDGAPVRHSLPQLTDENVAAAEQVQQSLAGERVSRQLDGAQYQQVKRLAATHKMSPYALINSLFAVLLSRYSGESDLVFGTLYAGRPDHRFQRTLGMFANTIPVRSQVDINSTLAQFVTSQTQLLQQIEQHQHLPFSEILAVHNPPRLASVMPLCQIMFSWQNFIAEEMSFSGLQGHMLDLPVPDCKFELKLDAIEQSNRLVFNWEYRTSLFSREFVNQLADSLLDMLDAAQSGWHQPLSQLAITGRAKPAVSEGSKQTLPEDFSLVQRLFAVAKTKPLATAIVSEPALHAKAVCESQQSGSVILNYQQVAQAVTAYTRYLREQGVEAGDTVALYMSRHATLPALYFAIWQCGASVVPLDKQYPKERVMHILDDADVKLLVTDEPQPELAAQWQVRHDWQQIDFALENITGAESSIAAASDKPDEATKAPAYVLYTSGTTGKPKGVCVGHKQLENFMLSFKEQLEYLLPGGFERWLWNASPGFDTSLKGLLTLAMGAELIVPADEVVMDMVKLAQLIHRHQIPIYNGTVTQFSHLRSHLEYQNPEQTVNLIIGGEAIKPEIWKDLLTYCAATKSRCINAYGPTETTINACYAPLCEGTIVNIGKPVVNTQLSVRDRNGAVLPVGAIGELWISGNQLAFGYNNNREKTAANFVSLQSSGVMQNSAIKDDVLENGRGKTNYYRSGDKVVMTPSGSLLYLGRCDRQIKLRGYRIELADIEQQCLAFPQVQQAHVCVRTIAGTEQLVAYLVGPQASESLRDALVSRLPGFMVPTHFVMLDALPYNQHGKVAEQALPKVTHLAETDCLLPETETETDLHSIWCEILQQDSIDCGSNFFALGGNSLNAMTVIQKTESLFDIRLKMSAVMENPTIRSLARHIEQEKEMELATLLQQVEDMSDDSVADLLEELAEQ